MVKPAFKDRTDYTLFRHQTGNWVHNASTRHRVRIYSTDNTHGHNFPKDFCRDFHSMLLCHVFIDHLTSIHLKGNSNVVLQTTGKMARNLSAGTQRMLPSPIISPTPASSKARWDTRSMCRI